jgi:anti-sigma28 factor (negative regulator of flagellin synthesis)
MGRYGGPAKEKQMPVAQQLKAVLRTKPTDTSLTFRDQSFRRPLGDVLEHAMDLTEIRTEHVSRIREEIVSGRYNVTSSELAEQLLKIAQRDFR